MSPDPRLVSIFEELELQQYIKIFEEHEVDYQTLFELNNFHLEEVIPNLGHRKKLRHWIEQHTSNSSVIKESTASGNDLSKLGTCSNASTMSIGGFMETNAEVILEVWDTTQADTLDQGPMKKAKQEHFVMEKSYVLQTNIFGDGKNLEQFLRSSRAGTALLESYKTHEHFINLERTQLVYMIGDQLCEVNDRVNDAQFARITEELVSLFPTESSGVYFNPAEGARKMSSGKIVARFRNRKRFITKSRKTSCDQEQEPNPELDLKLEWLKLTAEPWNKVEDWWEDTRPIRPTGCSINTYIKLFPALRMPLGYLLLEADFIHRHPGKEDALLSSWCNIAPKLWDILKKKPQATLQGSYTDQSDMNVSDLNLLRALPAALRGPVHRTTKNKLWKLNFSEVQDGFILVVKNEADLPAALQQRRDKLLHHGLTDQAIITAICPEENVFTSSQLHVENVKYKAHCLIRTLDLSFKLSMALNAEYTFAAKNIFLFLQRFVYEITTPYDKMTPSIAELSGELKRD